MAGLSVLLETGAHKNISSRKPQIISKATLHNPKISSPPATTTAAGASSGFLQRCSLCRRELDLGKDIYMYRGDRAFCSVECRHRQIFMDEADAGAGNHCAKGASAVRAGRRAAPTGGGFVY